MDARHAQRLAEIKRTRGFRVAEIGAIDPETRTVALAFSSEEPVRRVFGLEVLSHAPGAVAMGRLQNGAPLLLNHEAEHQIGVVESVGIDTDRRGRAVVRFGRGERAEEIFQDVRDQIRRHVSVGYLIHDAEPSGVRDGEEVWRIPEEPGAMAFARDAVFLPDGSLVVADAAAEVLRVADPFGSFTVVDSRRAPGVYCVEALDCATEACLP